MRKTDANQFRLHVLGAPDLRAPDGRRVTSVLSQPKRLGLLTYMVLSPAPVARARLVALFWPDSDEAQARNALSQAVFYLRRSLAERVVQSVEGDRLWAPPEHIWCDARDLLAGALPLADPAAGLPGELLDGWHADDSQELQEWLDRERRILRERAERLAPAPSPGPESAPGSGRVHPGSGPPRGRSSLSRVTGLAVLAVIAAALLISVPVMNRGQSQAAEPYGDLAVLLPQVTAAPGAPELDARVIHGEILAQLPTLEGLRIVAAAYTDSPQDFRRLALGIGAVGVPRWILEVNVRVASDEARVVGLLYRNPEFDVPGRASFGVRYGGASAALMETPQEIARGVSRMVAQALLSQARPSGS